MKRVMRICIYRENLWLSNRPKSAAFMVNIRGNVVLIIGFWGGLAIIYIYIYVCVCMYVSLYHCDDM